MLKVYSSSIGVVTGFIVLRWFLKRHRGSRLHAVAHQLAQDKRNARDRRRDELNHLLRTKYARHLPNRVIAQRIAQSTAVELLEGLGQNDFTYAQVTMVFSLRALKIGQVLNCTTEEFFDQAMENAERFDESRMSDELLLKGIPVSIKDHIDQQGADSSLGIASRNFRPVLEDSLVLRLLKDQGALAGFVRTTTMQGVMLPDTVSDTYGVTLNPFNPERSPGGSSGRSIVVENLNFDIIGRFSFSGGEGALIAVGGSPLGIGSDIGGSVRIPSHFCGIFGFKPTPGRVTYKGVIPASSRDEIGESHVESTIGPLARCTDDLVLVMRALLQERAWLDDPELARQPWREERFNDKKRLTIGYYTDDNWFSPAPACRRAVNEAAEALRKLGHTVVPYTPIDVPEAVRLFLGMIGADDNRHFFEVFEGEALNPLYAPLVKASMIPNFLRPLMAYFLELFGERRGAWVLRSSCAKTAYEYFDLVIDWRKYIKRWLVDLRENHIDLLLVSKENLRRIENESFSLTDTCQWLASLSSWSIR